MSGSLLTLKKRRQFLAAAKSGRKQVSKAVVLQARSRQQGEPEFESQLGIGFTASKKVGNAVQRNKAKRRMRAIARDLLDQEKRQLNQEFVFIARSAVLKRPYGKLKREVETALQRLIA